MDTDKVEPLAIILFRILQIFLAAQHLAVQTPLIFKILMLAKGAKDIICNPRHGEDGKWKGLKIQTTEI